MRSVSEDGHPRRASSLTLRTLCATATKCFSMSAPFYSSLSAVRDRMVVEQLADRGITSPAVLSAMGRVPRERFVPIEFLAEAYADRALPIDCQQTISQPYIVALMTQALELSGQESALEIGTGSGYQTAVLAELAANVVSVERHAELSAEAARVLAALGYKNVTLVVGDGTLGWAGRGSLRSNYRNRRRREAPRSALCAASRRRNPRHPGRNGGFTIARGRSQGRRTAASNRTLRLPLRPARRFGAAKL